MSRRISKLARKALVLELGGFRPPTSPFSSWFGKVLVAAEGEAWPTCDGEQMLPLAQINLTELPFRPERLDDVEFISIFVDSTRLPDDEPNGSKWLLRAYERITDLKAVEPPLLQSPMKPFCLRPVVIEKDYPCFEDLAERFDDLEDFDEEKFKNHGGLKLGGWPSLVQGEIFWGPGNEHPAAPEYVFQIDSTEKGRWSWGESGVGYFGRGTVQICTHDLLDDGNRPTSAASDVRDRLACRFSAIFGRATSALRPRRR